MLKCYYFEFGFMEGDLRLAKYQELVEQLKRQIKSGIWHPGDNAILLRR